jgi:glycosyltransferase involved in cell wall biosynthesis
VYRKNLEAIVHTFLCTVDALLRPYDVIHYHGVGPSTLAWIPRLLKPKARVVCTFHSQDRFHRKWGTFARLYLWFGEWAACAFPHATIAVSHVIQVYARKRYGRQPIFIPNGAEVQTVAATDRLSEFGLQPGRYILNVGRLVPHKGVHHLIEAFKSLLPTTNPPQPIKLVIVGGAAYTSSYEKWLKELAEEREDIVFLGYQSGEELRQLYAHAYLFVQPSESEGLPLVVLEAMSYGRPALVSDIPENLEAMCHAGFSFANKDADDLADKLRELMAHPEMVAEAAARTQETVRKNFNWEMIAVHTEAVYLSIER